MAVASIVGHISHMMLKEPLRSEAIEVLSPMDGQYLLTLGKPWIKSVTTPPPHRVHAHSLARSRTILVGDCGLRARSRARSERSADLRG